jgi:DNA-binding NtrC family response regulator
MYDYPWPGNVRELRHFVERAVALTDGRTIGPEALPDSFSPTATGEPLASGKGNYDTLVKKYRRQLVMEALQATGNNKVQTAQLLGISKSYLFKLIKQLSVPA